MSDYPTSYKAPSTPHQTLRSLKKGSIPPNKVFHLRGQTQDEVLETLSQILTTPQRQTCYLFIHGKGLRSTHHPPVLKQLVQQTLYHHRSVLAYCQALPKDGGSGALYALISCT